MMITIWQPSVGHVMASVSSSSSCIFLLVLSVAAASTSLPESQSGSPHASSAAALSEPLAPGLSWSYYNMSCPHLESIVRTHLVHVFMKDISQAAGLLRLHFHDCFVQGCEGSLLLDGSVDGPGEKTSKPNFTIRKDTFEIIEELRRIIQLRCGKGIVSCTDITALAAREAVFLSGGPEYDIPLGRKDGLDFASDTVTLASLPSPLANATELLQQATKRNLSATDLVALSGAHTIGKTRCMFMANRLYPKTDPTMDPALAQQLIKTCPDPTTDQRVNLDQRSPTRFDNQYFIDLQLRHGIFASDQDLYTDSRTKGIVDSFAADQDLFFAKFSSAMIKMGQLQVITGNKGQIRNVCSVTN